MTSAPYRRLADELVARIVSGELAPGSRLPAVRDLEALHGAATTQAAIAWLVANRWVVKSPGFGLHVAGQLPDLPPPPAVVSASTPPAAAPGTPAAEVDLAQLARDVAELQRWRADHERLHEPPPTTVQP